MPKFTVRLLDKRINLPMTYEIEAPSGDVAIALAKGYACEDVDVFPSEAPYLFDLLDVVPLEEKAV